MSLSTYVLILTLVALLSAKHFSDTTKLRGVYYMFASLFRGGFAAAIAIWTALILCWYFELPLREGFEYALLFLQTALLHAIACLVMRLVENLFSPNDDGGNLKF